SRYVIAWKLCATMAARDVTDTPELALAASGCAQARVRHRPRLLSDDGPGYIADALARWLGGREIEHIRGAPCHPQTPDEIEQSLSREVVLSSGCPRATARQRTGREVEARSRSHHGRPSFAAPVGARRPRLVHPSVSRR
ncbi:MAG: transposase, partial [Geminicoccaceae bacterium]|nr:transposase [Geminicoccaceae bacterium]